mgnify:CR=1
MKDTLARLTKFGDCVPFMERALQLIREERRRQDNRYGGPAHDDQHTLEEWAGFMAVRVATIRRAGVEEVAGELLQVAALAVAALESIARKQQASKAPSLKVWTDGCGVTVERRASGPAEESAMIVRAIQALVDELARLRSRGS